MSVSDDEQHGEDSGRQERLVRLSLLTDVVAVLNDPTRRLQNMQKLQQGGAGRGRGLGANGMPSPAQIAQMQVSTGQCLLLNQSDDFSSDVSVQCLQACCSKCVSPAATCKKS